jgi:Zn-dependent protease
MFDIYDIISFIASFCAVLIVTSFHEFAHAFVAFKCGDLTAKMNNRYTLNPFAHFDILGIIMFAVTGFGWAKPVPINPNNFHNYKKGLFWTASAGIIVNLIMAFVFYPIALVANKYLISDLPVILFIIYFLNYIYLYSLSFAVFNLLPLYPLDGFRIYDALNKIM